jgi:hypothetical protein
MVKQLTNQSYSFTLSVSRIEIRAHELKKIAYELIHVFNIRVIISIQCRCISLIDTKQGFDAIIEYI